MKIILFLLLQFFMLQLVIAAEPIKQLTVISFLQKAEAAAKKEGRQANRLIDESSPYLLLHAYNPVDWHPWGEAAFEKARKENKPIFLSIGYSTCHWCHVMAHESFENEEIAAILNKYFVSIKVDREQRPDIDAVYMSATELINGSGGWPMSVFLDNKLRPFHAATYYPPFSSQNHTGLKEILLTIHALWTEEPQRIAQVAENVTARIRAYADDTAASAVLAKNINAQALAQITEVYDEEFGGFSAAPKFPRPGIFAFSNQLAKNKNSEAQTMMRTTLDAMAAGGIYDQLGGGFHRYSVDGEWQVPHFEKMLYSQALMVLAYSDFYSLEAKPRYKQLVFATLDFVRREMRSPAGGFYSALDADSERPDGSGERAEGAYYLWSEAELKSLLPTAEFFLLKKYFHIQKNGNIHSDPQGEFAGLNIFYVDENFRDKALTVQQEKWLHSAQQVLNEARRMRPRPHLDDKIITAWNGMMISALAQAARVFDHDAFLAEAEHNIEFIRSHLYDKDSGKLFRQHRQNSRGVAAVLEDYVWLIHGLLAVHEAGGESRWLDWAYALQQKQDVLFLDKTSGAYFESTADDSNILFRSKSIYDGALPSPNAIALANLRKLSELATDVAHKKRLSEQGDRLVNSFAAAINDSPASAAMLLTVELAKH